MIYISDSSLSYTEGIWSHKDEEEGKGGMGIEPWSILTF